MNRKFLPTVSVTAFIVATVVFAAERTSPKPISSATPAYPAELTDSGTNGAAEVDVVVKADGTVTDPKLAMASHRAFGRVAMEAVANWKFEPASLDGRAVEAKVSIPFRFTAPPDQVINAAAHRKVFVAIQEPVLTEKDFPAKKLKVKRPAKAEYPRALMGRNLEGKVQVKLVVAPDGSTLNPSVVSSEHKEFEDPALHAAALMSYEPPLKDGKGVYVETVVTIEVAPGESGRRGGGGGTGGGGGGTRGGGGGGGGGGGSRR